MAHVHVDVQLRSLFVEELFWRFKEFGLVVQLGGLVLVGRCQGHCGAGGYLHQSRVGLLFSDLDARFGPFMLGCLGEV